MNGFQEQNRLMFEALTISLKRVEDRIKIVEDEVL
jgi:hypothetical protein